LVGDGVGADAEGEGDRTEALRIGVLDLTGFQPREVAAVDAGLRL
jgi:hypothetical protein